MQTFPELPRTHSAVSIIYATDVLVSSVIVGNHGQVTPGHILSVRDGVSGMNGLGTGAGHGLSGLVVPGHGGGRGQVEGIEFSLGDEGTRVLRDGDSGDVGVQAGHGDGLGERLVHHGCVGDEEVLHLLGKCGVD